MYMNNLITNVLTLGSDGLIPVQQHEETWYKYEGDTEWRTAMLGNKISLINGVGNSTGQIDNPKNIIAIEIGTGTQENPITSIWGYAFYSCSKLETVTIPNSVIDVGAWIFQDCPNLMSVIFIGKTLEEVQEMKYYNVWGIDTSIISVA